MGRRDTDHSVKVHIESLVRSTVPEAAMKAGARRALASADVGKAVIEVLVVGDARMRSMNVEHLQHDYTTDVLSFELGHLPDGSLMGQLVVCAPFAQRQAKRRGISREEELVRYVVHGCLHLVGHDDHDDAERETMWRVQEAIVQDLMAKSARR